MIYIFEKSDYFTTYFLQQCKRNAKILQFLLKQTNIIIKEIALKGGLYSQVVIIWSSIMKTKFTKEVLIKGKYHKNESAINDQNEDESDKYCSLINTNTLSW